MPPDGSALAIQAAEFLPDRGFTGSVKPLSAKESGMRTFDLRWPKTAATFYTDGRRCRIVWRGKKSGIGGTIENNDQCKRRVADSLGGAPELLEQLRAAGFMDLADEIQTLAPLPSPEQDPQ